MICPSAPHRSGCPRRNPAAHEQRDIMSKSSRFQLVKGVKQCPLAADLAVLGGCDTAVEAGLTTVDPVVDLDSLCRSLRLAEADGANDRW